MRSNDITSGAMLAYQPGRRITDTPPRLAMVASGHYVRRVRGEQGHGRGGRYLGWVKSLDKSTADGYAILMPMITFPGLVERAHRWAITGNDDDNPIDFTAVRALNLGRELIDKGELFQFPDPPTGWEWQAVRPSTLIGQWREELTGWAAKRRILAKAAEETRARESTTKKRVADVVAAIKALRLTDPEDSRTAIRPPINYGHPDPRLHVPLSVLEALARYAAKAEDTF